MKKVFAAMTVFALLIPLGCNKTSTGGPSSERSATGGAKDDNFTISVPKTATSIKQGEEKEVNITFSKGKNFKEDVKFTFSPSDKNVTVDPSTHTIKAEDASGTFPVKVKVGPKAAVGNATIDVTATPSKMAEKAAHETFTITVVEHHP